MSPRAPRPAPFLLLVLSLVLAALAAACGPREQPGGGAEPSPAPTAVARGLPAPESARGASLLLITLDTTRADHLGCYGDREASTPNLDRLAAGGIRVADAVTPVPMTLPAHASLLTGLTPPAHGVRVNGGHGLATDRVTLAEVLKGAGYRTAAFVSSFVLAPRFGLDQGFDTYDARFEATRAAAFGEQSERSAGAVTDAALAWLDRGRGDERPFFLWVHFYDPHDPYAPPEPYASRFADRPYDGEIAYVDEELGRLLAELDRTGLQASTVVVVAGDHGESLGEHGERYHSRSLYEGAVHVPVLLRVPGLASPRVLDDRVVSLADLFPTLLDLLDLEAPGATQGRSLLRAPADPGRTVYLETLNTYIDNGWAPLYAARRHRDKYIRAPRPEYYDLTADPSEQRNLLGGGEGDGPAARPALPEGASSLTSFLDARLAEQPDARQAARSFHPDARVQQRLEALGYLSGGLGGDEAAAPEELPDPKDMLPALDELVEGRRSMAAGHPEEAVEKARDLVRRTPRDRAALQLLAEGYAVLGRTDSAERVLHQSLKVGPTVGASVLLAQVIMQQRRFDEAEALLDQAAALEPGHGAVLVARGDLHLLQGRPDRALAFYRQALEADPYRTAGVARARIARVQALTGD